MQSLKNEIFEEALKRIDKDSISMRECILVETAIEKTKQKVIEQFRDKRYLFYQYCSEIQDKNKIDKIINDVYLTEL